MAYPGEVMKAAIPSAEDLPGRLRQRRPPKIKEEEIISPVPPAELNRVQNEAHDQIKQLIC